MKIVIKGFQGEGKSQAATRLAEHPIFIDRRVWIKDGEEPWVMHHDGAAGKWAVKIIIKFVAADAAFLKEARAEQGARIVKLGEALFGTEEEQAKAAQKADALDAETQADIDKSMERSMLGTPAQQAEDAALREGAAAFDRATDMTQADLFSAPKPPRAITLSEDQAEVLAGMTKWAARPTKLLTVGGLGGTGKSTILGVFAKEMEGRHPAFISFTGRAAGVLARKLLECGVKTSSDFGTKQEPADERLPLCTTIHRFLYHPVTNAEEEITGWKKRTSLTRQIPFVVIDEASMVGDKILKDIQALNVPILAVGDHGQLPPVQDAGSLMAAPMLKLEKIHRQAADNPIIQLAHGVRETGLLDVDMMSARGDADQRVRFETPARLTKIIQETHPLDRAIGDVGVICWRNVTRVKLNVQARTALGISGAPCKGEPVVCLRNIHARGIWNGMRGWLTTDARPGGEPWLLLIEVAFPEEGITAKLTVLAPQFSREKTYQSVEELTDRGVNVKTMSAAGDLFDFGYAMSCHKFQGSQVKTAIVYVDRPVDPWSTDWRRWMYTAATRASEKLIVIKAGAR